ncbi:hypothetical protein NLU13_5814 [Sarocladium strictum]|uniref:Uncharacterized protein n=1 Tax=Sarocladium strictum TaxID=5046 RepID=A0AA39GHM1_SARSR|nr:hypothetical protein NLU13_5814 [Sarocladium strictum]
MRWANICLALSLATGSVANKHQAKYEEVTYTTVGGYFLQDDPNTNPSSFDYAQVNLGLLNRTYPTDHSFDRHNKKPQWAKFARWVEYLNKNCRNRSKRDRTVYKVLIMGRHGQGWHNAAESYYGTPAWNCYWSELDGNGTAVWADAKLTPAGEAQALKANAFFKSHFAQDGLPYFESYYSSPLTRCTTTAQLTFGGIQTPHNRPFKPVIKELLRESISIHTCDRRSSKSYIHSAVPNFSFEKGFTERDELWRGTEGETSDHQLARSKQVLDDIFSNDDSTWISITSHSGEISSLLNVLGHRSFSLSTGQIIPVLVKAEVHQVEPEPATTTAPGFTAEATCTKPPITSNDSQGCVCSPTAVAL